MMAKWWKELFTPTHLILVAWMCVQGLVYGSQWVWARDAATDQQSQRVTGLEQALKAQDALIRAQGETIQVQHTFSAVVESRLGNIEKSIDNINSTLKEMTR